MKYVIYKNLFGYCVTTEKNYNARIQNERLVYKFYDFESVEEIIGYMCTYFDCKGDDFIIAV